MSVESYVRSLPIPGDAPSFNGTYLETVVDGYRTISFESRWDLNSDISEYETTGHWNVFRRKKYLSKDYTITFAITCSSSSQLNESIRVLKQTLHKCPEDTKVIFKDDPNIYYVGTIKDITLSRLVDQSNASGSFVIHLSDGRGFSVEEYENTASAHSGITDVTFNYDGTLECNPIIKATIGSQTPYFDCNLNGSTTIVIGDSSREREEKGVIADILDYDFTNYVQTASYKSQDNVWINADVAGGWYVPVSQEGTDEPEYDYSTEGGKFKKSQDNEGIVIDSDFFIGGYYGAFAMTTLSESVENIQANLEYKYYSPEIVLKESGGFEFIMFGNNPGSETRYEVARMSIYKRSNEAYFKLRLWVNEKVIYSKFFYQDSNLISDGITKSFIAKEADTIIFNINGETYSYTGLFEGLIPQITHFGFMMHETGYGGYPLVPNFQLNRITLIKDGFKSLRQGDEIIVDTEKANIYKNGVLIHSLGSIYNNYEKFLLEPGNNTAKFTYSRLASTAPIFKVVYRKVYL